MPIRPIRVRLRPLTIAALALLLVAGCDADQRLVRQAEQASQRQAEQNKAMAAVNEQVATATKELVEADKLARQESLAMQRGLQAEQARIGQQRDDLEAERRTLANDRHRDPIVAAALSGLGLIVACLLPLLLAVYVLRSGDSKSEEDAALAELLTVELVTDAPVLLPALPPATTRRSLPPAELDEPPFDEPTPHDDPEGSKA